MATHPPHIDGYDWDISDEPITYPERDVADACRRALQWCREQAPHLRADPGYVYIYDGVEYDAEAAELMTALQRSIEGWTWRRE